MALNIISADVVGVRNYAFTGNTGEKVNMTQVYCEFDDNQTLGKACCSVNMSEKKFMANALQVGGTIHVCLVNKRWEYVDIA